MHKTLLLVGLLVLVACDRTEYAERDTVALDSATVSTYSPLAAAYTPALLESTGFADVAETEPQVRGLTVAARMLIRRASATLAVPALEPAVHALDSTAARLGGYVAGSNVQSTGPVRSAWLTIRIPSPRLDEAVAALGALGKVESATVAADDVSEEFVDVTARLENARRLERRLLDLLAQRTGGLKDVLQVEQAMARVREEVERIEGRRRYLETHAATSALEVRLHEPTPVVRTDRLAGVFGDAVTAAWQNFVLLVAFGIASLGTVLPLGILAAGLWVVWRRRRRVAPDPGTA